MKGRVFIEPGDIVLITLREFGIFDPKKLKEVKNGDIIAKYASQQFAALKKEDGVNPKLFMKLETGGHCVGEIGTDYTDAVMNVPEDEGFEFENSESESGDEEATEIVQAMPIKVTRFAEDEDKEVNIDDI
jgi:hypothetical protein